MNVELDNIDYRLMMDKKKVIKQLSNIKLELLNIPVKAGSLTTLLLSI